MTHGLHRGGSTAHRCWTVTTSLLLRTSAMPLSRSLAFCLTLRPRRTSRRSYSYRKGTNHDDNDNEPQHGKSPPQPQQQPQLPKINWNDRAGLQTQCTLAEKGWQIKTVEWHTTHYGVGLFATANINAGTLLRVGTLGRNLFQFTSAQDIDAFCQYHSKNRNDCLRYVTDYLWGFSSSGTDDRGYPIVSSSLDKDEDAVEETSSSRTRNDRFFGMWLPGNGLNHSPMPNTVYRTHNNNNNNYSKGQTDHDDKTGIALVALTDIASGDELFDDYTRHGPAPPWLKEFAVTRGVTLNFADCNDFVLPNER